MNAEKLVIRTYRSLEELQPLVASWKTLLAQYSLATTFSTPEWLFPWWRNFGKNQELLVAGFFADAQLVGLAPLSITPVRLAKAIPMRMLRLMGDGSHDSDNLDLPVQPGFENQFAESLVAFVETGSPGWDYAELNTLPPASPAAAALGNIIRKKNWPAFEMQTPASAISLPPTWEEFLAQISSKERGKIRQYSRRLPIKYQTRFYKCESESDLPTCLDALFRLHQQRWQSAGQPGSFEVKERRDFYHDLGRALLPQGLLEFWLVDVDGQPAAAQFGFRFGQTVSQLQEGFDRRYSGDSIGKVLRAYAMQQMIAQGVRTYDFLGGEPGYKAKWGAQRRHYLDLIFAKPFSGGAAYLSARRFAGQSKTRLREYLPPSAWQALHRVNVAIRGGSRKSGAEEDANPQDTQES